ncbi:MAG TPA: RHS repeat-associated core domain-containing protein [Pyrinomonadaceae bacterium]|nr:RHS repeat-associated core domain-containing protein [Pyrinomonadaceae bacterium]
MMVGTAVSPLASYSYILGAEGNRTAVTELSGRTVNYTYDNLYRLTSESIANDPHGVNGSASYSYDPVGNRVNRSSAITPVPSQSSTYDANDRLTSDNYDNNGNTTSTGGNSYAYDFENHLTSLNGGSVRYIYDGDGNRVAKTIAGVTTNYLVDTNNPTGYAQVVDELQSGAVVRSFTYGHDLISQRIVGGSLSFYQYDGHGSVRQLTNAGGAITDAYDYDAFGNLIYRSGTTSNDYLYSGEQFDANLGFYYLRARYMNPSSGRFWTMDLFEGSAFDPGSLHKYLYGAANPITNLDPSGYQFLAEQNIAAMMEVTLAAMASLLLLKVVEDLTIKITLHPKFPPRPQPSPEPEPVPGPPPVFPAPTPQENSSRYVNFDTSTAEAIAMEGSSENGKIFAAVGGRQILMCATAIQEFQYRVGRFAGPNEQERAGRLIHMITPILDSPDPQVMAVPDPNGSRMNDKIIFGTGQAWRIQTFTADGTFVRHAESNGVIWTPYPFIHGPGRFTGQ